MSVFIGSILTQYSHTLYCYYFLHFDISNKIPIFAPSYLTTQHRKSLKIARLPTRYFYFSKYFAKYLFLNRLYQTIENLK